LANSAILGETKNTFEKLRADPNAKITATRDQVELVFPKPKPLTPITEFIVGQMIGTDKDIVKDLRKLTHPPANIANPIIAAAKILATPDLTHIEGYFDAVAFLPSDPEELLKLLKFCPNYLSKLAYGDPVNMFAAEASMDAAELMRDMEEPEVAKYSTLAHAMGIWVTSFLAEDVLKGQIPLADMGSAAGSPPHSPAHRRPPVTD